MCVQDGLQLLDALPAERKFLKGRSEVERKRRELDICGLTSSRPLLRLVAVAGGLL